MQHSNKKNLCLSGKNFLSGKPRRAFSYKALGVHHKYSTIVYAYNVGEAREVGRKCARGVMGVHARIIRDIVEEL